MQYQMGGLSAIPQLEDRTDEQLLSESKHRAAAKAILGARAAERYDGEAARKYFNEALAAAHPQERPMLAQAERRPDELREAMEKLGQEPPSNRQLMLLRLMSLVAPPPNAGALARVRGFAILIVLVLVLVAIGFGVAKLVALPFGGVGTIGAILLGLLIVAAVLGVLALVGRRRQDRARAAQRERMEAAQPRRTVRR
jgi:hypothetical protein